MAALNLNATAQSGETLVTLPADTSPLLTVRRANRIEAAPQAAQTVPLSQDVHGEQVVFKAGYGQATAGPVAAAEPTGLDALTLPEAIAGEVRSSC